MLKIKHVPMQLFDVTAFPIMFVLLYTYLFGGALAESPSAYLQDLLPGILVMTVAMIAIYTGMVLNTDIEKGTFDRFRSMHGTPAGNSILWVFVWSAALLAVFAPLAMRLYNAER